MKVKLDVGAHKPTRAHDTDAGLDLYAYNGGYIPPHGTKTFGTGVHIELPPRTCGLLVSKSGLLTKHGISSTGLIDEGYIGEIKVTLINNSDDDYFVSSDDKITQLVDSLIGGKRGDNGFGSTGK